MANDWLDDTRIKARGDFNGMLFREIEKRFTFHLARHTFATTITLSNGVPIETVSKLLGHRSIATTQIYARVLEHKVSKDMDNLRNILNTKSSTKTNKIKSE